MDQISRAVVDGDLTALVRGLQREPWLLGDDWVDFQAGLIASAALNDRGAFIVALLDLDPAILRRQQPPPSKAIECAFTYANTHLHSIAHPHLAGAGRSAACGRHGRPLAGEALVRQRGRGALGDLDDHVSLQRPRRARDHLHWGPPTAQQVLDTALAFAVINGHFDVADFLLEHGADINTNWNSHEPASILHHLVFYGSYDSMRFLIDRGIDMTIKDYRWNATARGWAFYAAKDEKMAQWLEEAERQREPRR